MCRRLLRLGFLASACVVLLVVALALALVPRESAADGQCSELMVAVAPFGTGGASSTACSREESVKAHRTLQYSGDMLPIWDGSVDRVCSRATAWFDVSQVLPGASAGPASAAATVDDPHFASAGCGFFALLDFARVMNAAFDDDSVSDLVLLYQDRGISSFADIASDLEVVLPLAITGYNGSFQDLADLNQPAIVHLNTEQGPHFAVVESISGGKVRIFDRGVMRIVPTDHLQSQFTGSLLTVEVERAPGQPIQLPRVLCPISIAPVRSAECEAPDQWVFSITNLGSAPLRLREVAIFPSGALRATTPAEVQPGDTREVVVRPVGSGLSLDEGWRLVIETNDPLRPLQWLSSGEIASSQAITTPS